jgi:DNA polymerase-1
MEALFDFMKKDTEGAEVIHDFGFNLAPVAYSPKSKLPVCDKNVMSQLLDMSWTPERAKELIHTYLEWSEYNTLRTRYIKNIEENIGPDGRLHPTYSFKFTSSGRTGARGPSIQNFPKRGEMAHLILSLIIAPPGKKLMAADHSMSELRWVAHVANERKMKQIFKDGGDIHLATGKRVSRVSEEDFMKMAPKAIKKMRQGAKAVNFGFIYGMSANGFKTYARSSYGITLSDKNARKWRNRYFDYYVDLEPWHIKCKRDIEQHGYIRHLFGRKRSLPNVESPDRAVSSEAIRIGTNFIIQGPSSDCTLMGGQNVKASEDYCKDEASIVIFIHDSLIYEIDEDKEQKYAGTIKRGMEDVDTSPYGFDLSVPLSIEIESGYDLSKMTPVDIDKGV